MITILAAACLAVPQDASLDRIPFQPSSTGQAGLGGLVSVAPQAQQDGAFLGVGLGGDGEARITNVVPRSAAAAAGLEVGDVIVSIDGNSIGAGADVSAALAQHAPGDSVAIVARRGEEEFSRDVILGRRPQSAAGGGLAPVPTIELAPSTMAPADPVAPSAPLRLRLAPRETQEAAPGFLGIMAAENEEGVAIEGVNPNGPAEGAGFVQGDVIREIDGRSIATVDELVETLGELGAGTNVDVLIVRDGEEQRLSVVLGARPGSEEIVELDELTPRIFEFDGGDGGLELFGEDFLIVEEDGDGGSGAGVGNGAASDDQREMMREFRTRMQEMRARHLAEMQELRAEMEEMFEAHGMAPRIQRLRERRVPADGMFFGGDGAQRFEFFDGGQQFDIQVPQRGAAPRIRLHGVTPGMPAVPAVPGQPGQPRIQFHGAMPGSQGQQEIVEVEVLPDGKRIERRRRAELLDGQWKWVEESVDELPAGTPGMGGVNHDAELQRTLQELRAQIDQLEKRAADLRAQHGGR